MLSYMYSNYAYSPNWKSVFCRTLWKGFGNTQEEKMFYLCVMSNAFIFDGFLSMGDICFSVYISKNRGMVLIDVLFLLEC